MKGFTRIVAIVAVVLALQLGQSAKATADGCVAGCEDPCGDCGSTPNDLTWE